jgi:hypothetical protein
MSMCMISLSVGVMPRTAFDAALHAAGSPRRGLNQ